MRLIRAFAAHELRTQWRSLRFRVLAAVYAAAGSGPALVIWLRRDPGGAAAGAATYAVETLEILPVLAAVLAFLISLDAITREQDEGAWSTVSLAGMSSAGYLLRAGSLCRRSVALSGSPAVARSGGSANGPARCPRTLLGPADVHRPIVLTLALARAGNDRLRRAQRLLLAASRSVFPMLATPLLGELGILGRDWLDCSAWRVARRS